MSFAQTQYVATLTEGVLTRRIFAWCIDVLAIAILVALAWVLLLLFGLLTLGLGFPLLAVLPVIPFAYHVLYVAGSGAATPGQSALDLIVRRDEDLGPPSFLQAVIFTAGLWLTLGSAFLLLIVAPFMPRKRALHDIVAGLVVVRKRALTQSAGSMNMAAGTSYR